MRLSNLNCVFGLWLELASEVGWSKARLTKVFAIVLFIVEKLEKTLNVPDSWFVLKRLTVTVADKTY